MSQRVERAIVERREKASATDKSRDQDGGKCAKEQDSQNPGGSASMRGPLGHRDDDAELKNGVGDDALCDPVSVTLAALISAKSDLSFVLETDMAEALAGPAA